MKRQSKAHFLNSKTEWVPTIPSCPLWAHEKQVIVQISYCALCPYLAFYHIEGVECMHGDADWELFLEDVQKSHKLNGGIPSWQQHPGIS